MEPCQQTNETPTANDGTPEHLPVAKWKKCFCIPQRVGIIILALIRLVLSLGLLVILLKALSLLDVFLFPGWLYTTIIGIAISINTIDIVVGLVIIISICLKNGRLMKMYYINSTDIFVSLSFSCCIIFFITFLDVVGLLIFFAIFFVVLVLQKYLNHLVKNEVLKMESNEQIQLY